MTRRVRLSWRFRDNSGIQTFFRFQSTSMAVHSRPMVAANRCIAFSTRGIPRARCVRATCIPAASLSFRTNTSTRRGTGTKVAATPDEDANSSGAPPTAPDVTDAERASGSGSGSADATSVSIDLEVKVETDEGSRSRSCSRSCSLPTTHSRRTHDALTTTHSRRRTHDDAPRRNA